MRIQVNGVDFASAIKATSLMTSKDDSRPILKYLHCTVSGNTLTVEGIDGYKAARYTCPVQESEGEGEFYLDPAIKMPVGKGYTVVITAHDDRAVVETGASNYIHKQPEKQEWPNTGQFWSEVEHRSDESVIHVNPSFLKTALTAFDGLGKSQSVALHVPHNNLKPVYLQGKNDGISVSGIVLPVRASQ